MDVVLGLLALLVGVVVCLSGYRLYFLLLPVWGFVAGFLVGAAGVSAIFGDGFLATTLGFVIGLVVGVCFAVASYLFWYVGAILSAASAGAVLGAALFASFGVDSAWLLFFIGIIAGTLFALGAVAVDYPLFVVVIGTAVAGAALAIGGILLVLDEIDRAELGTGALWQRIDDNLFLWLLWIVGAAIGLGAQLYKAQADAVQMERWARAQSGSAF